MVKDTKEGRYYGLGLLIVPDPTDISDKLLNCLTKVRNRRSGVMGEILKRFPDPMKKASVNGLLALKGRPFEFHFKEIIPEDIADYLTFVDTIFSFTGLCFHALVQDKTNPHFNTEKYPGTKDDSYVRLSRTLVKHKGPKGQQITLIADYQQRENGSLLTMSSEMKKLEGIANVLVADSQFSPLLQAVDVLLGAVMFDYRATDEGADRVGAAKMAVAQAIRKHIGAESLACNLCASNPFLFEVWEFAPKPTLYPSKAGAPTGRSPSGAQYPVPDLPTVSATDTNPSK